MIPFRSKYLNKTVPNLIFSLIFACLFSVSHAPFARADEPDLKKALWIWSSAEAVKDGHMECYFRKTFSPPAGTKSATVLITSDNDYDLFVNGHYVGGDGGADAIYWRSVERYDITPHLVEGENTLATRGQTFGGSAGMLVAVRLETDTGNALEFHTDGSWLVTQTPDLNWTISPFDTSQWLPAVEIAKMGNSIWGIVSHPNPTSPGVRDKPTLSEPPADYPWPQGAVFVQGFVPLAEPQNFIVSIRGSRAYFEHDTPCPAALGHKLSSLVPASPEGRLRVLHDAGKGLIGSPAVSYDGQTVYFSLAPEGEKFFHVYEIGADGSGLRAMTDGPFHDFDPAPLPDGRLVFSSTRLGSRDEYHGNLASPLFVRSADGSDIRPLTHHIVGDHEPRVTADGSIAFIRRDNFLERAKVETRIQQVRPDGSGGIVVLGADRGAIGYDPLRAAERNSSWLRQYGYGSPAPLPDGRVAAISNYGLVVSGARSSGAAEAERIPTSYMPYDIAATPDGRLLFTALRRDWIGLLDPQTGEMIKARAMPGESHSVVYLGPRPKPSMETAPTVDPEEERLLDKTGFLFCQSVFQTKQTNADMKRARSVRIFEGRPFPQRSAMHRFAHIGVEAVELGEVPLAADGSFYVRVPADRSLAIQAVDAEGRMVLSELTWIYVRPGERRSCVGCHAPRTSTPTMQKLSIAARFEPFDLTGRGDPHRYRGNNGANGGVLNLQFDRFREAATIDLFSHEPLAADAPTPGRAHDVKALSQLLHSPDDDQQISAARRLAILRDASAAPALAAALDDDSSPVRVAAALALSACGERSVVGRLTEALRDPDPFAAQAAGVALENLTGDKAQTNAPDWNAIETALIKRIPDIQAIDALGHAGDDDARDALRRYLKENQDTAPLRELISAMRALGRLRDREAVPLLSQIIADNARKDPGTALDLHELGWLQRPLYLTASAAEALGKIGSPEAEKALLESWPKLDIFWNYTWWTGDHDWLRGCNSSIIHYRYLEAFDAMETRDARDIIPGVLRSIPIDPDRQVLIERDGYETLTARVTRRSGLADEVIETCLSVLGDPGAHSSKKLLEAATASPPATSVLPYAPETRAAQVLSVVCLDPTYAPRVEAALERYRAREPSRIRSWSCFYLARLLGELRESSSVDTLIAAIDADPTEASFGFEEPPNVFVYKATAPFYRAAAARALGLLGDPKAAPVLLRAVANFDNATSVRQMAARSLGELAGRMAKNKRASFARDLRELAKDYPEEFTRRALLESLRQAEK